MKNKNVAVFSKNINNCELTKFYVINPYICSYRQDKPVKPHRVINGISEKCSCGSIIYSSNLDIHLSLDHDKLSKKQFFKTQ